MSRERESSSISDAKVGCSGCGCVLTLGLALSLFGIAIGASCSSRIPLTETNITAAGSIGAKEASRKALPGYTRLLLADDRNFINQSDTLTVWLAEGAGEFVVGYQEDSPNGIINIDFAGASR